MTETGAPSSSASNGSPSAGASWRANSMAEDLSFLLARANALSLSAGNAALRPLGLKVRSYAVLALACDGLRPTQRELADFLRLDPSQVVALIDDLEGRRLVDRRTDERDRRSKVIAPTAAGRRLCERARQAVRAAEAEPFAVLDAAERETLARLLSRVAFAEGGADDAGRATGGESLETLTTTETGDGAG